MFGNYFLFPSRFLAFICIFNLYIFSFLNAFEHDLLVNKTLEGNSRGDIPFFPVFLYIHSSDLTDP